MNDEHFLEALKSYIEQSEVAFDAQHGGDRNLKELVRDGKMPEVYVEVLKRLFVAIPGNSTDYKHINCNVLLMAADAVTPEQLQRKREGKNGLKPLSEESINQILDDWRKKLRREIPNCAGYFVFGNSA
jgi:hypothetical protein